MSGPDKLSLHIADDSMAIGVLLDDQRNRIMLYERVVFGIRRALGDDGLHAQLEDLPAAVEAVVASKSMATTPPSREHIQALHELAYDLDRIVLEVSSRDGDATVKQHQRASAVRAAISALGVCAECEGQGRYLDAPNNVLDGPSYEVVCERCDGSGGLRSMGFAIEKPHRPPHRVEPPCPGCAGRGVIGGYATVDIGVGTTSDAVDVMCPDCRGSGLADGGGR